MAIVLAEPAVDELAEVVGALRDWQRDDTPVQLHPGDLGWFWRFGAATTAAAVRTWRRDGRIVAVGLLDGAALLRLAVAPDARHDDMLGHRVVADLTDPARGVLGAGSVHVDAPADALVQDLLAGAGWGTADPWTPLRHDLTAPPAYPDLRIDAVGPDEAADRVAVQRAAFDNSTFTVERWHAMASGLPYAGARCLLALDDAGGAVAAATVWSAGPGRPGLLEPVGVHPAHRGHGYGRAITVAAAAALGELGSSSALVCTPSSNTAAVATYRSAGFRPLPEVRDRRRDP